jgi:predicted HTH transcriptional regulator
MATPTVTIAEIRALGESQTLEFKQSLSLMKEGFIDLCAMVNAANARGVVVFGIEPSGAVSGLGETNLDSAQQTLALHARQKLDPPLMPQIEPFLCDGKPILVLSGLRSRAVPFHEYDGRAYVRVGSSSQKMSVAEKQQLSLSRNRDLHNGPWRCDRCGSLAGSISYIEITDHGPRKTYKHSCGGEWWPAT